MASRATGQSRNQPDGESLSRPRRRSQRASSTQGSERGSVAGPLELDDLGSAPSPISEREVVAPANGGDELPSGLAHAKGDVPGCPVGMALTLDESGQAGDTNNTDSAAAQVGASGSAPPGGGVLGPPLPLSAYTHTAQEYPNHAPHPSGVQTRDPLTGRVVIAPTLAELHVAVARQRGGIQ
jgi:hypothetical protein